jgi:hypothetical protein
MAELRPIDTRYCSLFDLKIALVTPLSSAYDTAIPHADHAPGGLKAPSMRPGGLFVFPAAESRVFCGKPGIRGGRTGKQDLT